jgi:hypothetical protein
VDLGPPFPTYNLLSELEYILVCLNLLTFASLSSAVLLCSDSLIAGYVRNLSLLCSRATRPLAFTSLRAGLLCSNNLHRWRLLVDSGSHSLFHPPWTGLPHFPRCPNLGVQVSGAQGRKKEPGVDSVAWAGQKKTKRSSPLGSAQGAR